MTVLSTFSEWQPRYAAIGIPTFPCGADKRPKVRGYLKIGGETSAKLAARMPADALGFALGRRSGIAVVDVDTPDERILADALDRHGATPLIVRSGSGNFQAWYKWMGEGRQIRPSPGRPIDILGGGYLVAPPSRSAKGQYQIIAGSLDDLGLLPTMRHPDNDCATLIGAADPVGHGRRNAELFRHLLRDARFVDDFDTLLGLADKFNSNCSPSLLASELAATARSVWKYRALGLSNDRRRTRNWIDVDPETIGLLYSDQDAFLLLSLLNARNVGMEAFEITNEGVGAFFDWPRKRVAAARNRIAALGYITSLRPAHSNTPAVYSWSEVKEGGGGRGSVK